VEEKKLNQLEEDAVKSSMLSKEDAKDIKESIKGAKEFNKRVKYEQEKEKIDETKILLGIAFEKIVAVLKKYIKLKEEYYELVAVWIIGTYFMKDFETYPYLFINAQKGSGKTRLLKLIEKLVNKGELLVSMREAVLFRIATPETTILIDELENLDKKENYALKELLHSCYKRGSKVYRMKKKGEDYIAEAFFPFCSMAIANISGTDDILGDRCITIRLDKSSDKAYSSRQEDFESSPLIKSIRLDFEQIQCSNVDWCSSIYTIRGWNSYIDLVYNNTTYNTLYTYNTPNIEENTPLNDSVVSVFNRIAKSGITGRPLELVFPLLIVSLMLNKDIFEKVLKFSKELMDHKSEDDITESDDVSLIDFVSKMSSEMDYGKFRFVHELTDKFRFFLGIRKEREQENINPKWVGRSLKRLGLVIDKRRLSAGIEVKLNVNKAVKMLESSK